MSANSNSIKNFFYQLKKVRFYDKFFIFSIFLFPIALIAGPAVMEIIIFLNILLFFFYLEKFKIFINVKFFRLFFIIYFFVIISSLLSEFKLHSLKSSIFVIRFFIFYFIIYSILLKYNFLVRYLGYFFIIIIFFLIFDLFIQVIFEKNIFFFERQSPTIYAGMFGDEKVLGSFLVRITPIAIGLILWSNNIKSKLYLIISLLFFLFCCLFFTSERVAFIYFFIMTFFTFLLLIKQKIINLSKFTIILFIFSLLPLGLIHFKEHMFKEKIINTYQQIYNNNKLHFYSTKHQAFAETSINIFKDNLVLGGGANNYRNLYKNYNIYENKSNHPHNFFIQILGDLGLIGLFIYLYLFSLLIKLLFNSFSTKKYNLFFLCLSLFFYINPFFPSGNLFNNWFMGIGTFSLPFIFVFLKKKT